MPIIAAYMVPHPPLIIPDVGRGGEKQIEETKIAYERVAEEIAELAPDTIIISSPHATMYADYFHISPGNAVTGSFSRFGADKVKFIEEYDTALVSEIEKRAKKISFPAGTLGEVDRDLDHGTMVPLFFIRKKFKGGKIVRVGLSGLPLTDHYRMGQIIKDSVNATGKRVVYVASGDLSHKLQDYGPYGYAAEGPVYDQKVMDVCQRGAFGELLEFDEDFCDKAAECGHRSFVIMAGALDGVKVRANRLSHQDITGVGYGICTFTPGDEDASRRFLDIFYREKEREIKEKRQNLDAYVQLAYKSVYSYVLEKKVLPVPSDIPEEMLGIRAGAFVSIHEHGRLRGCIGTIGPTCENVAEEIIQNAISASTKDPRFNAITANELEFLEINVDVLGEPENISSMDELDVKRYGVIVSSGRKRGLLLPDLDGVDSVEQQVAIAMQKGGITEDDEVHLQRFEVVRHY